MDDRKISESEQYGEMRNNNEQFKTSTQCKIFNRRGFIRNKKKQLQISKQQEQL